MGGARVAANNLGKYLTILLDYKLLYSIHIVIDENTFLFLQNKMTNNENGVAIAIMKYLLKS